MTEIVLGSMDLSVVLTYLSDDCVESFVRHFIDGLGNVDESRVISNCKIISCLLLEKRVNNALTGKVVDKCLWALTVCPLIQMCSLVKLCCDALDVSHRREVYSNIFEVARILLDESEESRGFNCGVALCHQICSRCTDGALNEDLTSFMMKTVFSAGLGRLNRLMSPLEALVGAQIDNGFLAQLWKRLEGNHKAEKDDSLLTTLKVLGSLARYYVVLESAVNCYSLMNEPSFWEIIQDGLACSQSVARKQSLYLLKLAMVALGSTNETLKFPAFKWSQSHGSEALSSLCLACEVVEECQPHMVEPIFKILSNLAEFCEAGFLDSSWLIPIYSRLFHHESFIISRSAILSFCTAPSHCFSKESYSYQRILVDFFTACNNMLLFDQSNNSSSQLEEALTSWFSQLPTVAFNYFLSSMLKTRWGPIPLYHIMHSLSQSKRPASWANSSLLQLKQFVDSFLVSQNVMIRGAVQFTALDCLFSIATRPLDLDTLAHLLSAFPSSETFKRGSRVWSECSEWLKSVVEQQSADSFISNLSEELKDPSSHDIVSPSVTARMVVLLSDAGLFHPSASSPLVTALFSHFEHCVERPYSSFENQMFCVRFLNCLLSEGRFKSPDEADLVKSIAIPNHLEDICAFIGVRFKTELKCSDETSVLADIEEVLKLLENLRFIRSKTDVALVKIVNRKSLFENTKDPLELYYKFGIIETTIKYWPYLFNEPFIEELTTFLDPRNDSRDTEPSQSNATAKRLQTAWSCRYVLTQIRPASQIGWIADPSLLDAALTSTSTGGKEAVVSVLRVFSVALPLLEDDEKIVECLKGAWTACFENRKSELFWKAMRWWIMTAFQPALMERSELKVYLKQKALELVHLGNDVIGIANLLANQLQNCSGLSNLADYVDVIAECLLFGPVLRRDQRIEDDTCDLIRSRLGDDCVQDERRKHKKSGEVRTLSLKIVLLSKDVQFKIALVRDLVERDRQLAKENKKYFNDSEIHRRRNRLWQCLVVFERDLGDAKTREDLLKWLAESLINYSHQPSVRYLMEWLFVRMYLRGQSVEQFWYLFEESTSKPGPQCSFISIGFHLCRSCRESSFFEKFLENILPGCMSQNFNVRLYSQVALQKLWELFPEVALKYDVIRKNQHKVFEQGNALVNAQKIQNEFYFKCFDPERHYSLKTIFWDIPRLSNLAKDEWISCRELRETLGNELLRDISLGEEDTSLNEFISASWIPRAPDVDSSDSSASAIQKKYMPTKGNLDSSLRSERTVTSGLVLVTSLLDKASNLGGLARTGDIFGVRRLIVGSLQSVADKNFTSLSMTAESHLDIREVKPFKLKEYLKAMKEQGYSLVGAEQTTESVPLSQFTFPHKTVLLLGNEREGIPADLLSTLDSFVEIPQFGVVRSLNVHVTGAILLWEYAKQHFGLNNNSGGG